jgi:tetratricopeptide (TPR) repeat protein
MLNKTICFSLSIVSDDESHAQELVKRGEVDQALAIYQHLKYNSARVLNIIGSLYAEKKGDYDSAIKYHKKALHLQEKVTKKIRPSRHYERLSFFCIEGRRCQ